MPNNRMEMLEAVESISKIIRECKPLNRWELYARVSENLRASGEHLQSLHFKALATADMTEGTLIVKKKNIFANDPPPEVQGMTE